MQLTPAQIDIAKDTHRFRVLCCGRRFGKTTLAIEEILGKSLAKETKSAYIAPTYQQARDIAWADLKKRVHGLDPDINESRLEVTIPNRQGTHSRIVLRGWESIETLRGQSFDFLVLDEVAMMRNFWENWQEVLRPTLTDRRGEGMFISTPKGFNHFYDLYNLENEDKEYKSFHFSTGDNPHIPKDEIEAAKRELTEDRFFQEYMADFRKQEGLVYKEFDRGMHIFTDEHFDPKIAVDTIAGVDFGYANPAAVITIMLDYKNNYWVTGEWYKQGYTHDKIAEYVASRSFSKVYPDPASPEAIENMRKLGVNCYDVVKGKDSIVTGIQKIRELFLQGRLRIHESCTNLIWEIETYHYPDEKPGKNPTELPVKENDHALDALRYAIMSNEPFATAKRMRYNINNGMKRSDRIRSNETI